MNMFADARLLLRCEHLDHLAYLLHVFLRSRLSLATPYVKQ